MNDKPAEPTAADLPEGQYAIVEILGHRTLIGRIDEIERFGTKLLQVEPIFRGKLLDPVLHHGNAIYGLAPCSRETAFEKAPKQDWQLPDPVRARLEPALLAPPTRDVEDVDYEEEDEELPI
jgi:hypothetical protein